MTQADKSIPQNQSDAIAGGFTRIAVLEDGTRDVVFPGDAANKAVRVNVVAGASGGGNVNLTGINGVAPDVDSGPTSPGTLRVILPVDQTSIPVVPQIAYGAGNVGGDTTRVYVADDDIVQTNIVGLNGTQPDTDVGPSSPGTLRVVLANDQTPGVVVSGIAQVSIVGGSAQAISSDTYIATAPGAASTPAAFVASLFTLQVVALGAVTSWSVSLEVSIDGGFTWGPIATHTNADTSGGIVTPVRPTPAASYRTNCTALVLGAGTSITAFVMSTQI
jgi:hypothetical protein